MCRKVFVPKARGEGDSAALSIAAAYLRADAEIHELVFPMITDRKELARRWEDSAGQVAAVLQAGEDACFLTLGDPLLYSTYIYLLRALRKILPEVQAVTVPGVTAFSAAAALTDFPIGEAKEPVTIVPTADDLQALEEALARGGTVVLMKIGKRLGQDPGPAGEKKADGSSRLCFPGRACPNNGWKRTCENCGPKGRKPAICPLFWFMPEKANSKLEIRNPKQIQMTKIRNSKPLAHKPPRSTSRGIPFLQFLFRKGKLFRTFKF